MAIEKNSEQRKQELVAMDLLQLEEYVESFWQFLPVSACYVTPAFNILEISRSLEELSGFDASDLIGERLESSFLTPQESERIKALILEQGSVVHQEATLLTRSRQEVPVDLSASPRKDDQGDIVGYFFAFLEVSEVKKVEGQLQAKVKELERGTKELKETRKSLMNILEDVGEERKKTEEERDRTMAIIKNFVDALILVEDDKVTLINPPAKNLFDLTEEEVAGKNILDLESPKIIPLVNLIKEKGMNLRREELSYGQELILEVSTTPVLSQGKQTGQMIIIHNVTREKLVEKMKTEFVSITAHQLRTPLSAIKWILKMLLDGDLGSLTKSQKEFLEKTYNSNERMIRLINDLLNVTRIEEGRFLQKKEKQDIIKVVGKRIEAFAEVAAYRGLKFTFHKPTAKLPLISIDAEKIALSLQNLLDNAVHYTKEGGIEVSIELLKKEKKILFTVSDTGIGVPKSQIKRVFGKFFRGSNAIKAETEGTGLGLFIAKNIIEAHGGEIWFESKEGQGSKFYFTLPIN
jgi:two-component system sensor histidine kinase VicK